MAIEPVKAVWLFDPHGRERELLDALAAMGLFHVSATGVPSEEQLAALGIERVFPETPALEKRVQLLRDTLETLQPYSKSSRDLLSNFIPTPTEVSRAEVEQALADTNIEALHDEVRAEAQRHFAINTALGKAEDQLTDLAPWRYEQVMLAARSEQRRVDIMVGAMPARLLARLETDPRLTPETALRQVARQGRQALVQAAAPADQREALLALMRENEFEIIEPEAATMTLAEYAVRRDEEHLMLHKDLAASDERMRALASANLRRVEVALGYWEERLEIAQAASMLSRSKRLTILKGFVRSRELADFRTCLARELPDVAVLVREPDKAEAVPVSLRNARFFAPAQFLVNMFGLPEYFTFDPTPVIFFSFLIFFGFCFGDVLYGLLLIILGLVLARKYRAYPNLRNFFLLLTYGGVPTMIVGALTGAWAGDLYRPEYLGANNPLLKLKRIFMVADPVDQALKVLVLALAIGMANQLIGIIMLMVRNARQGDVKSAIYDGGFWLLLLPGVVILISTMFVTVPAALVHVAIALSAVGALGLVLTQGRGEKSVVGKVVVGVASLYGIVGSYGVTAFIGDTLSYSRLLALGLTTGIVAMCFNMIAGMSKELPFVGILLFLAILVFGHLLNFVLSILGGFVHSARLTFVEFFGRFYQGGAPRFAPLGAWRGRIRVTDAETVWNEK